MHATSVPEDIFSRTDLWSQVQCNLLVRLYLENKVPINVVNNPSGKMTQAVFRKLDWSSCFEFSSFWNVITKWSSLFAKVIATSCEESKNIWNPSPKSYSRNCWSLRIQFLEAIYRWHISSNPLWLVSVQSVLEIRIWKKLFLKPLQATKAELVFA